MPHSTCPWGIMLVQARGHSERGGYRRQDGDNQLNDKFPSLLFHVIQCLILHF